MPTTLLLIYSFHFRSAFQLTVTLPRLEMWVHSVIYFFLEFPVCDLELWPVTLIN